MASSSTVVRGSDPVSGVDRYIASIYRCEYTHGDHPVDDRWRPGGRNLGPTRRRPLYSGAVRRHTDYALARRALLRDLERGAVARLDVCDAHPELLRAARHVGEPAPARVPGVLGPPRPLRLLRLRRAPPPGQRPLHRAPERARAPRRRPRGVRPLRRRGVPRLRVELPHAPRAARPPPRRRRPHRSSPPRPAGRARSAP